MRLKELGLRFALTYLMGRASGAEKKEAAIDSFLGSTIAQAAEDVTGFTDDMADLTTTVVKDFVQGRRARETNTLKPLAATNAEVKEAMDQITDPDVGLTSSDLADELTDIKAGIDEAYFRLTRLEQLKAGVIKRN